MHQGVAQGVGDRLRAGDLGSPVGFIHNLGEPPLANQYARGPPEAAMCCAGAAAWFRALRNWGQVPQIPEPIKSIRMAGCH